MLNVCCVLLDIKTIDRFIKTYLKTNSRSLFAVISKKNYFWNKNKNLISKAPKKNSTMNTKYLDPMFEAAHCLQAGKLKDIGKEIWMGNYEKNDPQLNWCLRQRSRHAATDTKQNRTMVNKRITDLYNIAITHVESTSIDHKSVSVSWKYQFAWTISCIAS